MKPLLEFKSIPINIEMKINHAKYEMKTQQPGYNMTRQTGGLTINSVPAKLRIDSYNSRASMGIKSVGDSVREYASRGVAAANEAIENIVSEGNQMADIHIDTNAISDIAYQRTQTSIDTMLGFLPSVKPDISFDQNRLSMQYEMDKLTFDWRTNNRPEYQFVPGNVEYIVKEYPKLEIKYLGKPLYVPPSADPDYVPPQLNVTA